MFITLLTCTLTQNIDTSDKIAAFAAAVAIISVLVSLYTYQRSERISKAAFNRNFRPYVFANTVARFDDDKVVVHEMNAFNFNVLNAPAYILNKNISFYIQRAGMEPQLYYEVPAQQNLILFPNSGTQYMEYAPIFEINHEVALRLVPAVLTKKIRVDYGWISDNTTTYFFESEWAYNIQDRSWAIVYQKAD